MGRSVSLLAGEGRRRAGPRSGRTGASGHDSMAGRLLALQRSAGNGAVSSWLASLQREEDEELEDEGSTEVEPVELAPAEEAAPPELAIPDGAADPQVSTMDEPSQSSSDLSPEPGTDDASYAEPNMSYADVPDGATDSGTPDGRGGDIDDVLVSEGDDGVGTIEEVDVSCASQPSFGGGHGGSISLHGQTDGGFDHAQPLPAPFPSTVKVTTQMVGTQQVFSAHGFFNVTFLATPTITLPPMPSGLSECQQKAVQAFIDGPLTDHENAHKKAYKDKYDGSFRVNVNHDRILDTPDQRQAAIETPVQNEDVRRANVANAASLALDPWNKTIPGLDCDAS